MEQIAVYDQYTDSVYVSRLSEEVLARVASTSPKATLIHFFVNIESADV